MAESLGTIYYDVDANLEPLLGKMRQAEGALGGFSGQTKKADSATAGFNARQSATARAVRNANSQISSQSRAMSGLVKVVTAYLSLRALRSALDLADQYGEMASRIRDATSSTEEFNQVQSRLIDIANRTYRSIGEIQESYVQASRGLQNMGYSTAEVLDITESLSLAFVRNSTSADKAQSAMNALVRATNRGTVLTDHWASLLIAVPTILDDISAATGKSTEEISRLGYEGKLSAGMVTEALRMAKDENGRIADDMATTLNDAMVRLRNSFQMFVADVNEASGASGGLADSVDQLSQILQDPQVIQSAQQLATGIVTAFGWIITSAKEVVSFTRWMAEEVAATFNGIAADDVVRLEREADKIRKALEGGIVGMGERLRFFGPDGVVKFWSRSELEAELARIEAAVKASNARLGRDLKPISPAPVQGAPGVRTELFQARDTDNLAAAKKRLTDAERELLRAEMDRLRGMQSNIDVLGKLEEQIYQTTLGAEDLAVRQAELMLNEYATPEQVEQVKALAAELYAAQQAAAELERRRSAFAGDAAGAIRGQVSPLSGGAFDDQAARYAAEAAAEQERYAAQLARLREAKELEIEVIGGYQALEQQMAQEHADRLMQIEEARVQAMAAQSAAAFGAMASDLEAFAKTFGAENSKMMAIAKAAAIAQTIMETYAGAQKAFSALAGIPIVGPALGTAAAAAAIAGGMARVAQIRGTSGRLAGGPVNAGSMYRVNENGAPEVFSAANGQQFMIPNQRGEVISNRNATAGGGGVVINIHNAPQGTVAESSQDQDGQQMIDIWVADFMADGRTASAVQGKFGLSPQGR